MLIERKLPENPEKNREGEHRDAKKGRPLNWHYVLSRLIPVRSPTRGQSALLGWPRGPQMIEPD